MIGYRFLSPAEDEVSETAIFYESVGLGHDFLCQYPKSGRRINSKLRRMLLHRFPLSIIYFEEPDAIVIVSIAHHRRRPDYWQSRISE